MNQSTVNLQYKKKLKKTWGSFFARFGKLNPVQIAVIPPLLEGKNVIICSPTASGKTEAVFAPIIERIQPVKEEIGLHLLYVAPTRALVNNIYYRLESVIKMCGMKIAIRTGDRREYSMKKPEHLLLTTPESLDSLLCRYPHIFKTLKAIILDEIHLLDATFRGDQLRVLLERIRLEHAKAPLQYAALSATLYDPKETALSYFQPVEAISMGEPRPLQLHLFQDMERLIGFIKREKLHKILMFANSRKDVERLGTELKALWPKDRIMIHHGSLSKQARETAEQILRLWRWGICIATTTLEIGIDIGDFDGVVCYRPPLTPSSFQQRIGRGCRQVKMVQALGYCENEAEQSCFEIYAEMARIGQIEPLEYLPDISVAIQQLFSLLFAHPRGFPKKLLESLLSSLITPHQYEEIVNHLIDQGYFTYIRERFLATEKLMDLGEKGFIHSNIPSFKEYRVINRETGKKIGEIGMQATQGTIFVLGGRVWETMAIKGLNLYARPVAQKPQFRHFRKRSSLGAFSRLLPESLKQDLLKGI